LPLDWGFDTLTCTELPPVLRALVDSRAEWQTAQEIACALEVDIQEVHHEIARLRTEGYVDLWARAPGGPAITFSVWGAATLGYSVIENKVSPDVYRWTKGKPDPDPPRRRRRPGCEDDEVLIMDLVVEPGPGPAEQAIARIDGESRGEMCAERWRRGLPIRPEDVPLPTVILWGHVLWPWEESLAKGETRPPRTCKACIPAKKRRKVLKVSCDRCGRGSRPRPKLDVCPACKGRRISRTTFCLRCGRWGWDEFFGGKRARYRA
jgi:hypothetical protein